MKLEKNTKLLLLRLANFLILTLAVIIIGWVLMICTYGLNQKVDYSYKTYTSTQETFNGEEEYQKVTKNNNSVLDNFTDPLMVLTAMHPIKSGDNFVTAAMKNTRTQIDSPKNTFKNEIEKGSEIDYSRYWHGYLIFLKPLLRFTDYNGIRTINMVMQIILLVALIVLLIKKKYYFLIVPFLCMYGMISPTTIFKSMQYSTVWYIILISSILYLLFQEKILEYKLHYLVFLLVGMLTSYFDLLTWPIATLGVLLIIVVSTEKLNFWESIKRILVCGFSWCFGYGVMWLFKVLIAALILGDNKVIEEAKTALLQRKSSKSTSGVEITDTTFYTRLLSIYGQDRKGVIPSTNQSSLFILFNNALFFNCFMISTIVGGISIAWVILKNKVAKIGEFVNKFTKRENDKDIEDLEYFSVIDSKSTRYAINVISKLAVIAFVWYKLARQHSYAHTFMTYRTLSVMFFAIFSLLFKLAYDLDRILNYESNRSKGGKKRGKV